MTRFYSRLLGEDMVNWKRGKQQVLEDCALREETRENGRSESEQEIV